MRARAEPSSATDRRTAAGPSTRSSAARGAAPTLRQLQRSVGNSAVADLLHRATGSGGLRIDPPGSAAEREAERAADEAGRAPVCARDPAGARGRLPAGSRLLHESRLGEDLSDVRVHTDETAALSARALGARAYTVGRDIVFGRGRYAPGTPDGERLIGHELAHVVQQRRDGPPRVQRDEEDCPWIGIHGGVPSILDCTLADLNADDDTSCCSSTTRELVPGLYAQARDHTDRALERLRSGANMDGAIRRHFGGGGLWQRAEIQRRLQIVRDELDEESTHVVRCRIAQSLLTAPGECIVNWEGVDGRLFCRLDVAASGRLGGNVVTLCIDLHGRPAGGWTTLLHEMVHLTGLADLPAFQASPNQVQATADQIAAGEFEMYEHEARYPNPTSYALRNADSFAMFVRDVGAASWSEESNPAAYLPTVEAGPVLTLEDTPRPGVGGRFLWTPFGDNFQFIAGVGGVWLPRLEEREAEHPPELTDLRAYVGAEFGLRWIVGGDDIQFVLDVAGGGGPYVTVDDDVDPALMGRLGLGARFGGPEASFGVSAEVMRLLHLRDSEVVGDEASDWLGGLVLRGTWGGSSETPR